MEKGEQQPEEPLALERLSPDEFLALRHQLLRDCEQNGISLIDKLNEEVPVLAQRDSVRATEFIEALARSEVEDDRNSAAIDVGNLFAVNRERAIEILLALLQDESADVRDQAFQTLEVQVREERLSFPEAVPLAQAYFAAKEREDRSE